MMQQATRLTKEIVGTKKRRRTLRCLHDHCIELKARIFIAFRAPIKLTLTGLVMLLSCWKAIQADGLSEAQIKAAYLYNFAKFVEWPETLPQDAPISLCVVGSNVLDGELQILNGRKAGEHELKVVQLGYADQNLSSCQLLFIGNSEQQRFVVTLKALNDASALTLSEIEDFAEKGGGISLLFRDNKVVFEVNLEPIRRAGLRLPGQLLNIATHVYGR